MLKIKAQTAFLLILWALFLSGCVASTRDISLDRVVVTGASVTAGWGVKTPPVKGDFGAYPVNLRHIIEAMIVIPHEEVAYFGDEMFFMRPTSHGSALIDEIIAYKPTAVIALDYLFWYGYGPVLGAEDARLKKFDLGLEQLERIESLLIVGNMPDMRVAVERMLSPNQVPTEETIAAMTRRLQSWAAQRAGVVVIDVHDIVADLIADREIVLPSHTWPAGSQSKLLQADMLHPTLEGTVALSLLIADAIGIDGLQDDPTILMKRAAVIARGHEN